MKIMIYADPGHAGLAVAEQVKAHVEAVSHTGEMKIVIRQSSAALARHWRAGISIDVAAKEWAAAISPWTLLPASAS